VFVPFGSVFSIPLELVYFLLKHPINLDNRARVVVALFASFILLCGITHSFNAARMDLILRYLADHPGASDEDVHAYPPVGDWGMALLVSKVITAIVSIITVVVLLLVVPQVIRMARLIPQLEEGLRTNIAELNEARAAAEAAMQRKSEFMAFLCHEIRNPVSQRFPAAAMRSTGPKYTRSDAVRLARPCSHVFHVRFASCECLLFPFSSCMFVHSAYNSHTSAQCTCEPARPVLSHTS
jgi:hypothetical protein